MAKCREHTILCKLWKATLWRTRCPEGPLLLAVSWDRCVKQVTADSTTRGFGFVPVPSLELAFCLQSSLCLYSSVSLFPSSGWRTPICCSYEKGSCEQETNNGSVTFRGFLVPTISISDSFVKLSGPSPIVSCISFSPWVHSTPLFFFFISSKLPSHSSCSGWHLRLHLSSPSSVKASCFFQLFFVHFLSTHTTLHCSLLPRCANLISQLVANHRLMLYFSPQRPSYPCGHLALTGREVFLTTKVTPDGMSPSGQSTSVNGRYQLENMGKGLP